MVRNLPANEGDAGSIPGSGRSPGEGNDNPLRYSCLENSMDGGACWAIVYKAAESDTSSDWARAHTHTHTGYMPFPTDAGKCLWLSKLHLDSVPRGLVIGSKADGSGAQFPTMSGFKKMFLYPVTHLISLAVWHKATHRNITQLSFSTSSLNLSEFPGAYHFIGNPPSNWLTEIVFTISSKKHCSTYK